MNKLPTPGFFSASTCEACEDGFPVTDDCFQAAGAELQNCPDDGGDDGDCGSEDDEQVADSTQCSSHADCDNVFYSNGDQCIHLGETYCYKNPNNQLDYCAGGATDCYACEDNDAFDGGACPAISNCEAHCYVPKSKVTTQLTMSGVTPDNFEDAKGAIKTSVKEAMEPVVVTVEQITLTLVTTDRRMLTDAAVINAEIEVDSTQATTVSNAVADPSFAGDVTAELETIAATDDTVAGMGVTAVSTPVVEEITTTTTTTTTTEDSDATTTEESDATTTEAAATTTEESTTTTADSTTTTSSGDLNSSAGFLSAVIGVCVALMAM